MKKLLKRYRMALILVVFYFVLFFINESLFKESVTETKNNLVEMLQVIPPIFLLLGLLDVWVPKETMVKMMGHESGLSGILLAFFIGSAAAGPLYGAFPVALTLLKKGSSLRNVFIMVGAWSTTKIPLIMFEASSMGLTFTALRFGLNIIGIMGIAILNEKILGKEECHTIIEHAQTLESH